MVLEITMVAIMVALSCALPGVFLVLNGQAMISDGITHTVLLGIVLAYFVVKDLTSPWLMVGATLVGLLTVYLVEMLTETRLVTSDAALGIVYPFLFSVALILMTRFASHVHLDVDAVFTGELGFTIFSRFQPGDLDLGPVAFWVSLVIFAINLAFVIFFYKELKVISFDPHFAQSLGLPMRSLYYALMTLVSLTAVGAFDSVGSILVVGYIVGPGLTGYLLANRLSRVIWISLLTAIFNAVVGVQLAYRLDLSYAGVIACVTGLVVLVAFIFSPEKGALRYWMRRREFEARLKDISLKSHS